MIWRVDASKINAFTVATKADHVCERRMRCAIDGSAVAPANSRWMLIRQRGGQPFRKFFYQHLMLIIIYHQNVTANFGHYC